MADKTQSFEEYAIDVLRSRFNAVDQLEQQHNKEHEKEGRLSLRSSASVELTAEETTELIKHLSIIRAAKLIRFTIKEVLK